MQKSDYPLKLNRRVRRGRRGLAVVIWFFCGPGDNCGEKK
mgnify:FL=1